MTWSVPSLQSCLHWLHGSNAAGLAVVLWSKPSRLATVLFALVGASVTGCGRPVLISEDSPIRIGPNTKGCVYMLIEGEWTLSEQPVQLPEGWYAVPPSFVTEESP